MIRDYIHNQKIADKWMYKEIICLAMRSVADTCIIPIQDYLGYDNRARINTPSTLGSNWQWRLKEGEITPELLAEIKEYTRIYGRLAGQEEKKAAAETENRQ